MKKKMILKQVIFRLQFQNMQKGRTFLFFLSKSVPLVWGQPKLAEVAEIGWLLIIVISFFFLSTQEAISQFP
jgi:hypothetical protein